MGIDPRYPQPKPPARERTRRAREDRRRLARGTWPPVPTAEGPAPARAPRPWTEPVWKKTARRLVSGPGLLVATVLYLALLPALLLYAVPADRIRRRPLFLARFHLTIAAVLVWHVVGLCALFCWWLAGGRWIGLRPRRWHEWNLGLEGWWGDLVIAIGELLYGMRIEVRGDAGLLPGPVLIFSRHASIIDTMLPLRVLEHWHGMTARIVKKNELLWDPCVDSISHRLPRTFVERGGKDRERELDKVRALAAGMGERDGLWLFPEGTRFSPKKRQRILERLAARQPEAARRAVELTRTLPPRPAGALALLESCPGVDVVFCAHTGLEGAGRLENLVGGSLYRRRVKVEFWRVPAEEIPAGRDERLAWLHGWWKKIDRWVDENQDPDLTRLLDRE